jgi:hypothetical protein
MEVLMLNSRTHGVLDYLTAIVLIVAPYLFGFANGGAAQLVPQVIGALIILMSLLTAYELSVAKLVPFRVHLGVDIAQAILLLVSPWLFGFADVIWWPHVLVGLFELAVVAGSWSRATDYRAHA